MDDKIKMQGIMEQGYGISPKLVMRDKDLSIEAKAIYAYMSSFAGNGESAFPRVETACKDLDISRNRFNRHRKMLEDKGYITVKRERKQGGKFDNNVYIINHTIASKHHHGDLPPWQNDTTNNNKELNNNSSFNSSSSAHEFYSNNFGMITPFIAENIEHWINDLNETLVIESMKIALKSGKKFNYAEGILKDWLKNKVKTIDDVKAKQREFDRKPNNKKSKFIEEVNF